MMKKIVIVGPESTGKSTICQELSDHYSQHYATSWVPEYAREYLEAIDRPYDYNDLLEIAKGQLDLEEKAAAELQQRAGDLPSVLFIDTNMVVMQVWSEVVFNQCHPFILDEVANRRYDYYLLMQTDLPWAYDRLREYPDLESRERLFRQYLDILQRQETPWSLVSGIGKERTESAIRIIDQLPIE